MKCGELFDRTYMSNSLLNLRIMCVCRFVNCLKDLSQSLLPWCPGIHDEKKSYTPDRAILEMNVEEKGVSGWLESDGVQQTPVGGQT